VYKVRVGIPSSVLLTFHWLKILIIYVFLLLLMCFDWFCQEMMEDRCLEDLIVFP